MEENKVIEEKLYCDRMDTNMAEQNRSEEVSIATEFSFRRDSLDFLENFESIQQNGFAKFKGRIFFVKEGSEAHRKILDSSEKRGGMNYPLGQEVVLGVVFRRYHIDESFFEGLDKQAGDQV